MNKLRAAIAAGALILLAASLAAQVPSRPEIVGAGTIESLEAELALLSGCYFEGRWDSLQRQADRLFLSRSAHGHAFDPKHGCYIFVFLSREEGGLPRLIRFAWHKPAPALYAARIPGKKEIFEIVLGADSDFELLTSYVSTELEDPLLAEVPRFVKKVEPALGEWIRGQKKKPGEMAVNYHVRRVPLPFARAKIKIADVAVPSEANKALLDDLAAAGVKDVKASFDFENAPPRRLSFGLISAYMLGRGYAADRTRLTDDGYFAADPPENPLTAAILNIHPAAYDPEAVKMTPAERFRLFTGVVMTPDPGFCAGAGIALLRGLTVNAGAALTGFRVAADPRAVSVGGRPKTEPADPDRPFKTSWRTVGFVGLGYVF